MKLLKDRWKILCEVLVDSIDRFGNFSWDCCNYKCYVIVNKILKNTLKSRLWRSFENIPTLGSTGETNNWHLLLRIFPLATHKGSCILNNLHRSVIMTPKSGDSEDEYTEDAQEVFE